MTDFPTGADIIAQNYGGLIGKPIDRVDGWAKVMGEADYSADIAEAGPPLHGVIVTAPIGRGVLSSIDVSAAEASPGVALVLTHENAPQQTPFMHPAGAPSPFVTAKPVLETPEVKAFGAPIALVVADSWENARAAAALIKPEFTEWPGDTDFEGRAGDADLPIAGEVRKGDFEAAFAAAAVQLDETYSTPAHNHAQMEPHATVAVWNEGRLTVYTSIQGLKGSQRSIAETLQIPREQVRVISRYIGGGFGGKAHVSPDCVLAAMAARILDRPVKVAMTRQQMFHLSTHRSASIQRVRLASDADGRLLALEHEGVLHCAAYYQFTENVSGLTRALYSPEHLHTRHRLVKLDAPMADAVRAPGGAVGTMAIEAAMDELADRLGIDPIELRLRNEPQTDENGRPFATRTLKACLLEGAERFGWRQRDPRPGQRRDWGLLVGMGMGSAVWHTILMPARAAVVLHADGTATILQAMTDIGTGTYTILAQIAGEALGLEPRRVRVELGDSDLPAAPGSGGSFGAATAGSAVLDAAMAVRRAAAELAVADLDGPLAGARAEDATFGGGRIMIGNRAVELSELLSRHAPEGLRAEGRIEVPKDYAAKSRNAYGANFAEVSVDPLTGEVRLRRMLGVFGAGRILNEKTARSQALGGMIWGVGAALSEANHFDPRFGSFVAQDLAAYHMPVHADIVDLDAYFMPETGDDNPLGIKGVGELGICGAGAAIANAIYNACGVRVRDYPITMDKVLAGLIKEQG